MISKISATNSGTWLGGLIEVIQTPERFVVPMNFFGWFFAVMGVLLTFAAIYCAAIQDDDSKSWKIYLPVGAGFFMLISLSNIMRAIHPSDGAAFWALTIIYGVLFAAVVVLAYKSHSFYFNWGAFAVPPIAFGCAAVYDKASENLASVPISWFAFFLIIGIAAGFMLLYKSK